MDTKIENTHRHPSYSGSSDLSALHAASARSTAILYFQPPIRPLPYLLTPWYFDSDLKISNKFTAWLVFLLSLYASVYYGSTGPWARHIPWVQVPPMAIIRRRTLAGIQNSSIPIRPQFSAGISVCRYLLPRFTRPLPQVACLNFNRIH